MRGEVCVTFSCHPRSVHPSIRLERLNRIAKVLASGESKGAGQVGRGGAGQGEGGAGTEDRTSRPIHIYSKHANREGKSFFLKYVS